MGPLFVVLPHPLRTDLAHLIQRLEHIDVEYLVAERVIELVIPRSFLLRGQSFLVPSGVWRTRGTRQSERERTGRGKSITILSFP